VVPVPVLNTLATAEQGCMVCAAELQQDVNKELWQALKLAKGKGVLTVMPVASYSWAMPNCREPWLHPCGRSLQDPGWLGQRA
jgi:hypothetical protein